MSSDTLIVLYEQHVYQSNRQNAKQEVFWVFQHCLSVSWMQLSSSKRSDISADKLALLDCCLVDYQRGKPLAYILGSVPFLDLELYIEEGVLIPRVDTERVVLAAINYLSKGASLLELGVGSGAISCSLALRVADLSVVCIDKSSQAIKVAEKNIEKYDLAQKITTLKADWFSALAVEKVNMVIANPPYIAKNDSAIMPEVRQFEPREALFSNNNGLADLFHIIKLSKQYLKPNGYLVLEHGYTQQPAVVANLIKEKFSIVQKGNDGTHPRYVIAKL